MTRFSELLALGSDEMLSDMSDDDSAHDKDYVQLSESTDSEEEIPSPRDAMTHREVQA